jgi:hypothetical protein
MLVEITAQQQQQLLLLLDNVQIKGSDAEAVIGLKMALRKPIQPLQPQPEEVK